MMCVCVCVYIRYKLISSNSTKINAVEIVLRLSKETIRRSKPWLWISIGFPQRATQMSQHVLI